MSESAENNWEDLRKHVLERDNRECRFCGQTDQDHRQEYGRGLDVHHIIPKSDGGEDAAGNLAALCRSCHRTLESLHGQAMAQIKQKDDYTTDLAGINHVHDEAREKEQACHDTLSQWVENHPTFAKAANMWVEEDGVVNSHHLEKPLPLGAGSHSATAPESEFQAAAMYGFAEGLIEVYADIDGRTEYPFDVPDLDELYGD